MASTKSGASESLPTVLGANGTIDLSGEGGSRPVLRRASSAPAADAWLADRGRRSLLPVAQSAPEDAPDELAPVTLDLHPEIAERFALGDFAGALRAAELRLGEEPGDENARRYAKTSRERLEARYTTRIGSVDDIFNLAVPAAKVKWLGLDPQAGFLLSLVDGQTTVAEVLDLCGMGRLEALRLFTELLEAKAIVRVA
jgi:hypothetical protein